MELRVEAEDAAAEQAVEQLVAPRADGERLRVRPGNVPERDDRRVRQPLADHPRQQREVVVLHQHDRVVGLRLGDDGVGEARVDLAVVLPVGRAERRPHVRDVAERPQALVGEAVVVAGLLLPREPDAADAGTPACSGGTATRSWRSTVSRSAEPLPWAIHVPEQARITGSSAVTRPLAGRCTRMPSAVADVDVGLAVRHDDDVVAAQLAAQRRAQRLLVPDALAAVERPVLPLEVADQLAQVAGDRAQLRRRGRRAGRRMPSPRSSARRPCTQPRQDSCAMTTVISATLRAQRDEEVEQVAPRLLAAALDEAHVVDEHELGAIGARRTSSGAHRDVQQAAGRAQHAARRRRVGVGSAAQPDLAAESSASRSARPAPSRHRPTAYSRSSCSIRLKKAGDLRRRPGRRRGPPAAPAPSSRSGSTGCRGRGRTSAASARRRAAPRRRRTRRSRSAAGRGSAATVAWPRIPHTGSPWQCRIYATPASIPRVQHRQKEGGEAPKLRLTATILLPEPASRSRRNAWTLSYCAILMLTSAEPNRAQSDAAHTSAEQLH